MFKFPPHTFWKSSPYEFFAIFEGYCQNVEKPVGSDELIDMILEDNLRNKNGNHT